jgi:hypothetical protein
MENGGISFATECRTMAADDLHQKACLRSYRDVPGQVARAGRMFANVAAAMNRSSELGDRNELTSAARCFNGGRVN